MLALVDSEMLRRVLGGFSMLLAALLCRDHRGGGTAEPSSGPRFHLTNINTGMSMNVQTKDLTHL
jgi:hypothetical protein